MPATSYVRFEYFFPYVLFLSGYAFDVSDPIVRFLRNGDEGETVILRLIGFSHLILGIYRFER